MSTEAYAYKSDFNSAKDFRYRIKLTGMSEPGAGEGTIYQNNAEQAEVAVPGTIANIGISRTFERSNMRFGALVRALSEGENPVELKVIEETQAGGIATALTISVEYSREPHGYDTNGVAVIGQPFIISAVQKGLENPYTETRHLFDPTSDPSVTREDITAITMTGGNYTIAVDNPTGVNAGPF